MSNSSDSQQLQQKALTDVTVGRDLKIEGGINQEINIYYGNVPIPTIISLEWMWQNFEEVRANAGARYTPEVHVDLPEAWVFEGLGRTEKFFDRLQSLYGELYRKLRGVNPSQELRQKIPALAQDLENLCQSGTELINGLQQINRNSTSEISFQTFKDLAEGLEAQGHSCLNATLEAEASFDSNVHEQRNQQGRNQPPERSIQSARHNISQLLDVLEKLCLFATDASAKAANTKSLLLLGDAGTGKTHLFCDVAKRRLEQGLPTIILLGQHFNQSEPWNQILQRLQLPFSNRDEFLAALNTTGSNIGKRALILIDALNEGEGKRLWRNELSGILRVLEDYPYIGLGVSCRTSYKPIVIPGERALEKIAEVEHRGFENHEYAATTTFFHEYGIERPNVPPLVPEFSNPLFLKIFCESLAKRKLTSIPRGLKGITAIFQFFINSIHENLCPLLDYDPFENLPLKAVDVIARHMAETGQPWVERAEARDLIDGLLPGRSYQQSLFANLLSEGLLSEDLVYLATEPEEGESRQLEVVKFPYERFSDHLIVRYLLNTHLNIDDLSSSFSPTQPLGSLVHDISRAYMVGGWIEALTIQLPEQTGLELIEIVPSFKTGYLAKHTFLESLIWRDFSKITEATKEYLNEVYADENWTEKVYNLMLTIAAEPNHPYNANFLHHHLMRLEMSDRDELWSIYLFRNYDSQSAIDRLVEWAWDAEKSHISDEAIELCATALAWFLTTSHRYLRDRATKALVSMLHPRPKILIKVLEKFTEVNDLYVLERLYAVAYGVSMISQDIQAIGELSSNVYTWVFAENKPPAHIMLRDYARGVIETANYRGVLPLDLDIEKVRPPYKTEWLTNIPSEADLEANGRLSEGGRDFAGGGLVAIQSSVMGFGDFHRYVIGTNHGFFPWSSCRLDVKGKLETLAERKSRFDNFLNSLTQRQKQAWEKNENAQSNIKWLRKMDESEQIEEIGQSLLQEEWDELSAYMENRFLKTIGKKKQALYKDHILPHILDPQGDQFRFDLSTVQRWIFQRVFELGWNEEKFDYFDRYINRNGLGRHANKAERIGKKYQWIAYHEFLAYVADNFEFIGDGFNDDEIQHYEGSWQISTRDIDPSLLLRQIPDFDKYNHTPTWWQTTECSFADVDADTDAKRNWIIDREQDLDPVRFLEVTSPVDESHWIALEGHFNWTERGPIEEEHFSGTKRQMWFHVRSYIARRQDADELLAWLQEQNFMGRWMPELETVYELYLGEYPWAPASMRFRNQEQTRARYDERLPAPVVVTTANYLCESSTHDCSIDDSISALIPSAWLIENMALKWSSNGFRYVDSSNELTAFDPSAEEAGPGTLLISKEKLVRFLDENQFVLFWTILGERLLTHSYEWTGSVEMSGVYSFQDGQLSGGPLKAWQRLPNSEKQLLE